MTSWCSARRSLMVLIGILLAASASFAQVQLQPGQYQPQVGQPGKDVVWVPTPQELVDRMLDMAKVTPQDYVMDLGSGDGRTVITAAKRGARARGIEYNPDMVVVSKANAIKEGVTDKASFEQADLFETDLSQATVITMFLLPQINLKLRPKLLELKPGTRIVSNSFDMGDWQADETSSVKDNCSSWCTALLWIVPARAEGAWRMGGNRLTLKQEYQMLTGTLDADGKQVPITEGRLRGTAVSFTAGGVEYVGRVNGDSMEGTVRSSNGNGASWSATRTEK